MASEQILAARRVRALEDQARQMAETNARLDLIMKNLGIVYPQAFASDEAKPVVPPEGEPEPVVPASKSAKVSRNK